VTRLDPFDHAFAELAESRFPEIRDEAESEHRDTADRPQFAALRAVQHLLGEVESPEVLEEHPEAAGEYLTALYVAFRYWDAGRHTFPVPRDHLEGAFAGPIPSERPSVPYRACYLQLPERWFWAQIDPAEPHEPLDGLFVVAGGQDREVIILAVLGLRAGRPGFSQVSMATVPEDLVMAHRSARDPIFATTLDGGVEAGLRSVTTPAEVLHLAYLALHDVTTST
jgi:hypothetical protein